MKKTLQRPVQVRPALELITPEKATEYLKSNETNRMVRPVYVETLAVDMRRGRWVPNHQGIAFDSDGNLIDGQHRLHAVVLAKQSVWMLVSRGWKPNISVNGTPLMTMDSVDRGRVRTIGDQLHIRHGIKNGNLTAACAMTIAQICHEGANVKLTTSGTLKILDLFGQSVEHCVETRSNERVLRTALVIGACAFALRSGAKRTQEFWDLLVTGEGLHKTGPTSPVYELRRALSAGVTPSAGARRWNTICRTLSAARKFSEGTDLHRSKMSTLGVEYFVNLQKANVAKVVEITSL